LLSCNLVADAISGDPAGPEIPVHEARFSSIIFCEGVSDQGDPLNPTDSFPAGTTEQKGVYCSPHTLLPRSGVGCMESPMRLPTS